jgi:hypothetical protein
MQMKEQDEKRNENRTSTVCVFYNSTLLISRMFNNRLKLEKKTVFYCFQKIMVLPHLNGETHIFYLSHNL